MATGRADDDSPFLDTVIEETEERRREWLESLDRSEHFGEEN